MTNPNDDTKHIAIKKLCAILDSFPRERRHDALMRTGIAIGCDRDRTGIPLSMDRPIKHLFWDIEVEQLKERMVQLVDEIGVDESTIVLGVIHNLDWHFRRHADRDFADSCRVNNDSLLEKLRKDLEMPMEQRSYKNTDDGLRDFISKIEDAIENIEFNRQNAEKSLHYLQSESEPLFEWKLWDAIAGIKIDEKRPFIDGFDNNDES